MEPKQKLGQGSYFPTTSDRDERGVTIRQKIAADVLCALLSNRDYLIIPMERLIMDAIEYTDEFLRKEAE